MSRRVEGASPVLAVLLGAAAVLSVASTAASAAAQEIAPARLGGIGAPTVGVFANRTVSVALELDRDGARLIGFTLKGRPFERPVEPPAARASVEGGTAQVEVVLLGPGERRYTQRIEVRGLCLAHAPDDPPHIQGDTIRLHRESLVVEVPEIAGFDRLEVGYYTKHEASLAPTARTGAGGTVPAVAAGGGAAPAATAGGLGAMATVTTGRGAATPIVTFAGGSAPAATAGGLGVTPAVTPVGGAATPATTRVLGALPATLTGGPGIPAMPAPGGEAADPTLARIGLRALRLTPDRFTPAGGTARYTDLAFADATPTGEMSPLSTPAGGTARDTDLAFADAAPSGAASALLTPGTVHWPEEFGDPLRYTVYGNEAETSRRINLVIVPDGYTYAQKATMQSHAQALVNYFRGKTPYAEHDPFINYILVYAYSTESGTDQCDCSIVKDTAMATRFPRITATCGSQDNRCLYYGTDNGGPNCDPNTSTTNITAAEMRAPAIDRAIIMVNTTRYGGCGGNRAVYSAGNGSATEIAVHELGHSLAGLADEYAYDAGCGFAAGEINTSTNGDTGAWPEWFFDLGPPWVGAEYYQQCLYRPTSDCVMRALSLPFCPVCNQQWALVFFGWYRVFPTAPIASSTPTPFVNTTAGVSRAFSVTTRLATGTTNAITWQIEGPGFPGPTVVATDTTSYSRSFAPEGDYILTCEVAADTNFVKPAKYAANRDIVAWSVHAAPVPEVSDDSVHELIVEKSGSSVNLRFEDVGAAAYNVYVSATPVTSPFAVADPAGGKKDCALAGVTSIGGGMNQVSGYSLESGLTGDTRLLFILVTADNGAASEGSLGRDSTAIERSADAYCNR